MINDRYIIKKKLGEGRSTVYLCEDLEMPDTNIAIKILPANSSKEEAKTFLDEYFILGRLYHPNIIRSFEYGTVVTTKDNSHEVEIGSKFFTQEFYEGINLLNDENLSNEEYLIEVIKQLSSALFYLHQSNYIYYDFKAENILIKTIDGKPHVKMVDFGFAKNTFENEEYEIRGTAEYIAPEILKKEEHDHRVDLYAFGILLYKIVYGKFPFETDTELNIYKAHLEEEFEFPSTHYSEKLLNIIKKLLAKDISERYFNSIQVLYDLGIDVNDKIKNDFMPARVVADRKDSFNILKKYISDEQSGEVFVIKGLEDAGKTSLLYKIYYEFDNVIFLRGNYAKSGIEFLKILLKKIFFNDFIYSNLSSDLKDDIQNILSSDKENILNQIRIAFSQLSAVNKFILLLDDFNKYDSFTVEILHEIIPILQVNRVKVIIAESSEQPYLSGFINNLREIDLMPFTDVQLKEFFESSYANFFPKDELRKNVTMYADFLPGSVVNFILDSLFFNLLVYGYNEITIQLDDEAINLLKSSHEVIYDARFQSLTNEEKRLAQIIAAFDIIVGKEIIAEIFNQDKKNISSIINELNKKNIIYAPNDSIPPYFQSDGFKKFVYSTIEDKEQLHLDIGKILQQKFPSTNKNEIARHFELAKEFFTSYKILKEEINEAEKLSAFSYKKKLLEHLLNFPLDSSIKLEINIDLSNVLYSLGEFTQAKKLIDELLQLKLRENQKRELLKMQGISLIKIGEAEKGIRLLNELIEKTNEEKEKLNLLSETARGYLDLSNLSQVVTICSKIIESEISDTIDKGKSYNLLGLAEIFQDNNLDKALNYFFDAEKQYEEANSKFDVAVMQINIGNIYNMKSEYDLAEEYWNKSLMTNFSVGNLEHEGKLLDNLGIFHFKKLNFDKALEEYSRALNIFLAIGNRDQEATVLINLSEIYFLTCEYNSALISLTEANSKFSDLKNTVEEIETVFLLAEIYFIIGSYEEFEEYLIFFENKIGDGLKAGKYLLYGNYLSSYKMFLNKNYHGTITLLDSSKSEFLNLEDDLHFFRATMLQVNSLIIEHEYIKALKLLSDEILINICKDNYLFESELNYMMGLLAESDKTLNLKPQIEYFEKAFNLLQEKNINELTWMLLFKLSEAYLRRGDLNKAKWFSHYGKELINHIAEKIRNEKIRRSYLEQESRVKALETFMSIEKNQN